MTTDERIAEAAELYSNKIPYDDIPIDVRPAFKAGAAFGLALEREKLKVALKQLSICVGALKSVVNWFDDLQKGQDDQLMHGLERACEEWDNLYQPPLDIQALRDALKQIEQPTTEG